MAGTPDGAGSRRKPGVASVPERDLNGPERDLNGDKMVVKKPRARDRGSIPGGLMHLGGRGRI